MIPTFCPQELQVLANTHVKGSAIITYIFYVLVFYIWHSKPVCILYLIAHLNSHCLSSSQQPDSGSGYCINAVLKLALKIWLLKECLRGRNMGTLIFKIKG